MTRQNTPRMGVAVLATVVLFAFCGTARVTADFIFGTPKNCGPTINTVYGEHIGSVSPDGLTLYFSDGGPFPARPSGYGSGDIWVTTRETLDSPWGEPHNLSPLVNTAVAEALPSISADGLSLYFIRVSGPGDEDIYVTTRPSLDAAWTLPMDLGGEINSTYRDYFPHISVDGLTLHFCSHRSGNGDLYTATRKRLDEPFGSPVPIGVPINTEGEEETCPWISPDGCTLFFTSMGPEGYDIFMSRRLSQDHPWDEPVNLGLPVSTPGGESGTSVTADGSRFFFHGGHGGIGFGSTDIWEAEVCPIVDFNSDGKVDSRDASILVDHWLQDEPLCDIGPMPWGDGIVDIEDLLVLAEYLEPGYRCVARWKLDESEGTAAYDSVGENDGYVFGDATWQPEAGRVNGALELDGVDDYVTTDFVLDPAAAPFRVLVWVKGGAPGQTIVAQSPGSGLGSIWLGTDPSDGTLMTELMLPQPALSSPAVVTGDQWHEVTLEWDGKRRHVYVDAEEVAVDEIDLVKIQCNGWLNIGAAGPAESETFWSGLIDDVRIESRTPKP